MMRLQFQITFASSPQMRLLCFSSRHQLGTKFYHRRNLFELRFCHYPWLAPYSTNLAPVGYNGVLPARQNLRNLQQNPRSPTPERQVFCLRRKLYMKFSKSPRSGNLIVEVEPGNNRLLTESPITALKEILVPIDFSDCSKHALRYAIAFAKQFQGRITLLSVVHDSHTSFESGNPEHIANIDSKCQMQSRELAKLVDTLLRELPNQVLVRSGRPYEEIVKTADDLGSDMIVISTHGDMGFLRAEFGSTAERVIRYAPCPVLVVRQKEREFAPPA